MGEQDMTDHQQAERRIGERQVSVLINAGIAHESNDALCRIRNLSSGGAMIECGLPLAMDDRVDLQLRSGRMIEAVVRWVKDGQAGLSFDHPKSAQWVAEKPGQQALELSPIGFPIFQREAWARMTVGPRHGRAHIAAISPIGIALENISEWQNERVLSLSIDGLGDHLARQANAGFKGLDDLFCLIFVQPLNFRMLNDWLATQPRLLDMPCAFDEAVSGQRSSM